MRTTRAHTRMSYKLFKTALMIRIHDRIRNTERHRRMVYKRWAHDRFPQHRENALDEKHKAPGRVLG